MDLYGLIVSFSLIVILPIAYSNTAEDTCFMTFVLPKEKVKHSCDVQEQMEKKLEALEGQVLYHKQLIKDLENQIVRERTTELPPRDKLEADQGTGPIEEEEEDIFIPLPDLSDDYPDFADFFPPEIAPRAGQPTRTKKPKKTNIKLVGIEFLRPYIDREISKLRSNLTKEIKASLNEPRLPEGFDGMDRSSKDNLTVESNNQGSESSFHTIAMSNILLQLSTVQDKILHVNTQNVLLNKKVSFMETRLATINKVTGQRTNDLRTRVLQLEHENQLLKMNMTCANNLREIQDKVSREISEAKSDIKMNCKRRRRPHLRARTSQVDYDYLDEADNFIDDDWEPEASLFAEMEKNITTLQGIISHQAQQLDEARRKNEWYWNQTDTMLRQEITDRLQGDHKVNISTQASVANVQQDIDNLNDEVGLVTENTNQIQEDINNNHIEVSKQLTSVKGLLVELHEDTALNFTKQNKYMNGLSTLMTSSIRKLEKSDQELSLALKSALGQSNQKLSENRRSIQEWRERVWENNMTLLHLSTDLRSLSEQVTVSVHNLNESVRTLGVQLKINNDTWIPFNFSHSKSHLKCYGEKYVKRTNYASGSIVGVILCTKDMYKIFLSDSLADTFLNIADSNGFGHDHCEFVGGKLERTTKLGNTPVFYTREPGYKRSGWGEQPRLTDLGIMNPSPEWYRCGVTIPN